MEMRLKKLTGDLDVERTVFQVNAQSSEVVLGEEKVENGKERPRKKV